MSFRIILRSVLCAAALAVGFVSGVQSAEPPTIIPDVVYGHKSGLAMTYDVIQPEKPNGAAILFMVSGGWVSRWSPPESLVRDAPRDPNAFEQLVAGGFTVIPVRHGSSPKFKVPEAFNDVQRAVRHVRLNAARYRVDPERLGVFGGSAGGHLALMLGTASDEGLTDGTDEVDRTSNRVSAVVALFPPTDLRRIVGPSRRFPALDFDPELAPGVSPLLHVSADDPPTLLIHGDRDELVPLSNSQKMHDALTAGKVTSKLIVLEGAGHGFRGEARQDANQATIAWFREHLIN